MTVIWTCTEEWDVKKKKRSWDSVESGYWCRFRSPFRYYEHKGLPVHFLGQRSSQDPISVQCPHCITIVWPHLTVICGQDLIISLFSLTQDVTSLYQSAQNWYETISFGFVHADQKSFFKILDKIITRGFMIVWYLLILVVRLMVYTDDIFTSLHIITNKPTDKQRCCFWYETFHSS